MAIILPEAGVNNSGEPFAPQDTVMLSAEDYSDGHRISTLDSTNGRVEFSDIAQEDEQAPPIGVARERALERTKIAVAAATAVIDLPGVNEALWAGVIGATAATTHSVSLTAATATVYTGAAQFASAWGSAKTLATRTAVTIASSERVRKFNEGTRRRLGALGLNLGSETGLVADTAIAYVAGQPVMLGAKQVQNPERTERQNRRRGFAVAPLTTLLGAPVSVAFAEGAANGTLGWETRAAIPAAALGLAAAAQHIARRFLGRGSRVRNTEAASEVAQLPIPYDTYRAEMRRLEVGPQLHGFNATDYEKVIRDEATRFVPLGEAGFEAWPALTPIRNFSEYVPGYFSQRYGNEQQVYYLSLPSPEMIRDNRVFAEELRRQILQLSADQQALIVFDELDGINAAGYIESLMSEANLQFEDFIDEKNGTSARSIHYAARGITSDEMRGSHIMPLGASVEAIRALYQRMVASGEVDLNASAVTRVLSPEDMHRAYSGSSDQLLVNRLQDIYGQQFTRLIENNPARGAQTAEELETMLTDPGTLTVAHFVDGEVVAFMMFVSNIEACDWLNVNYYKQAYPNEFLLYFPGIASDISRKGHHYSFNLVDLATKLVASTSDEVRLVWQCTNISKDYIPQLVRDGITATGYASVEEPTAVASYSMRGFRVVDAEQGMQL